MCHGMISYRIIWFTSINIESFNVETRQSNFYLSMLFKLSSNIINR